jgi:hypothetical protein
MQFSLAYFYFILLVSKYVLPSAALIVNPGSVLSSSYAYKTKGKITVLRVTRLVVPGGPGRLGTRISVVRLETFRRNNHVA